jgi:menaquinone-dependent protoporphyrinogen oxidase
MAIKVLVAYGSKHGATREIAERIGAALQKEGFDADILSADEVGDPSVYDAFVIGSASYFGNWRKEAAALLGGNEYLLSRRPVWLFSSGPTGEGDPLEFTKGRRLPRSLEPIAESIKPRDIALFSGQVDPEKLGFVEKRAVKAAKAPIGDFRDWNAISSWARNIAESLKRSE